jgi:hypothetical protein
MWMLSLVPDSFLLYIVNAILIVGAVGSFFSFFLLHRIVRWLPWLAPYHLILQIVSMILLVAGVYFKGGYGVEMEWREKLRVAEERARSAEEQAGKKNVEIQTKVVEKIKVVKDTQYVIQEKIKEVEKVIDAKCEVATEAVDIHNAAAKNRKPGEQK